MKHLVPFIENKLHYTDQTTIMVVIIELIHDLQTNTLRRTSRLPTRIKEEW